MTNPKLPELLPCPFCGGKAALCQWKDTQDPNATWIECKQCAVMTDSYHADKPEDAAVASAQVWNTRCAPERQKVRELVEALLFYADQAHYLNTKENLYTDVERDGGLVASEALKTTAERKMS